MVWQKKCIDSSWTGIYRGKIYMMNSSMDALREAQKAFAGEAEGLGINDDNDVMEMVKEVRRQLTWST